MPPAWTNIDTTPKMAFCDAADMLAELCRGINDREEFLGESPHAWAILGANPADGSAFEGDPKTQRWPALLGEMVDELDDLVLDSRWVDSDGTAYSGAGTEAGGVIPDGSGRSVANPNDASWFVGRIREILEDLQYRITTSSASVAYVGIVESVSTDCDGGVVDALPRPSLDSADTADPAPIYAGVADIGQMITQSTGSGIVISGSQWDRYRNVGKVTISPPNTLGDVVKIEINLGGIRVHHAEYVESPGFQVDIGPVFSSVDIEVRVSSSSEVGSATGATVGTGTLIDSLNQDDVTPHAENSPPATPENFPNTWVDITSSFSSTPASAYYFLIQPTEGTELLSEVPERDEPDCDAGPSETGLRGSTNVRATTSSAIQLRVVYHSEVSIA